MKHLGTPGPDPTVGNAQEMRCLNRLVRYVQPPFQPDECAYIEWEAEPRHVEILIAQAELNEAKAKSLSTPGVKMPKGANCAKLEPEEKQRYRNMTMSLAYLARDRPDLQYAAKELARNMQEPTMWDREQLKRACRYLLGNARIVQRFVW